MRGVVFWSPISLLPLKSFKCLVLKLEKYLLRLKVKSLISSCGVCHSDLHVIKGEIPFPSPCAIGHEITGEVRHDDLCEDFFAYNRSKGTLYDGETRLFLRNSGNELFMGGLAEYCVVPAHGLTILPNSLPYSVFTAYGAMAHAAQVRPGDSVAVIRVGGVGCSQIARAFGASDIIAVDVQDEKLEKAKTFGATATINPKIEDPIERITPMDCLEITGGRGVDIAVQVIVSYGGRARQDLPMLVKLAESGIFNLADAVTRKYGFEEAGKTFQDLNQGKIVSRAVVEMT
ncbi:alcohol dehydrogenase class [Salix suchowensis]|nr:alcohol dehydrogenase class [Salix suchowensis]